MTIAATTETLMESISIGRLGSVSGLDDDACQIFVLVALKVADVEPCVRVISRRTPVCLSQR
jgi:hypothetical protein